MKRIFLTFLMALIVIVSHADERMFFISRSVNANIVCYDARLKNGQLDMKSPVHVYWHNNCKRKGEEYELTFFQRKMAYGYDVKKKGANYVDIKLTAYDERMITVMKHNGHWISKVNISGKPCALKEIKVKTKPSNSMSVEYIILVGKSLADGSTVTEKIINK